MLPVWRQRGQLSRGEGGEEPAEAEHLGRAPAPGLAVHLLGGQPRREVGRRVRGQGALERGEVGGGEGGEAGVGHQRGPLRAAEAAQQLAQRGRLRGAQGVGGGLLVGGEVVVQQLDGESGIIVGGVTQVPAIWCKVSVYDPHIMLFISIYLPMIEIPSMCSCLTSMRSTSSCTTAGSRLLSLIISSLLIGFIADLW